MKWSIGWGITSACNMNCGFCYSKKVRSYTPDIPIENCYRFIEENHTQINAINYGTGENSLINDWYNLVDYVNKEYHIPQALTTNGFVSNVLSNDKEKRVQFLRSISEVDVSIDYKDEEKHCSLRGNPNVYKWAVDCLSFCKEEGIASTIVFVGMKDNLSKRNIDGLFELAEKYDAKLRMNLYRPTIGINESSQIYIPSYDQIISILEYINNTYKVLSLDDSLFGSLLVNGYRGKDPSGTSSLRILPNGDITPSTYLISSNYVIGNIKTPNALQNISPLFSKAECKCCQDCDLYASCQGGVIDRRYLWYGTANAPDPYCPFKNGYDVPEFQIDTSDVQEDDINSIHHGYLPTMFFKP